MKQCKPVKQFLVISVIVILASTSVTSAATVSQSDIPDIHENRFSDNNDVRSKENNFCFVFGYGYFWEYTMKDTVLLEIMRAMVKIVDLFIEITEFVYIAVLIAFAVTTNIIPKIRMPFSPQILGDVGVGYIQTIGINGSWQAGTPSSYAVIKGLYIEKFAGIWLQLPIPRYIDGLIGCFDCFFGYARHVEVSAL